MEQIIKITESEYNKLIDKAVAVRDMNSETNITKGSCIFLTKDQLPTIRELKRNNIGPEPENVINEAILAYLIFYGEQECIDAEEGEYDYIYKPDKKIFTEEEIEEFSETRKYIEKTLIKKIQIL